MKSKEKRSFGNGLRALGSMDSMDMGFPTGEYRVFLVATGTGKTGQRVGRMNFKVMKIKLMETISLEGTKIATHFHFKFQNCSRVQRKMHPFLSGTSG